MSQENQTQESAVETQAAEGAEAKAKKAKNSVKKADLTQAMLHEAFTLDEAGNFFWKVDTVASRAGDFAGSKREADGYYSVVFKGTNYSGKQLAHFYTTGEWPVRAPKAEKVKAERKERPVRGAPVITDEMKAAAKAKLKAAAEARKAAGQAAEPGDAEAMADGGEPVAE